MRLSHVVSRSITRLTAMLLVLVPLAALAASGRARQQDSAQPAVVGKRIWLRDAQQIAVRHVGSAQSVQAIASAQPLALAEGDFDADGVEDVVVGYASPNGGILALHRGNLDAFAPQSAFSFRAIGRGDFPSPFMRTARLFDLPVRPDFVQVGSFNGEGYPDVVIAARGDSSLYLLANDGKGNFAAPKAINVGGPITTLSVGDFGPHGVYSKLLVGIGDHSGYYLMVYTGSQNGLGGLSVLPLRGPASNIVFGAFGGGSDAVFISGGKVVILHASSMRQEMLSLPVTARSLALGSFIWDRNPQQQIAILGSDGSVHIAAHSEFDPRAYTTEELRAIARARRAGQPNPLASLQTGPSNGWKIVESFRGVASSGEAVLLRTRISDHGADDVMVLDPSRQEMTLIAHPDLAPGATDFMSAEISSRPYNGSPLAAIAMRTNVDGRPGVIAIHQGQVAPSVMMPLPDPTFTVNTTSDGVFPGACAAGTANECTLREAVIEANATPGMDTIMIPTGTYTLTIPRAATPVYDARTGTLDVTDSVNIIGAGQNSTIIQGGTVGVPGTPNGVDKVFSFNQDITAFTNATVSVSNLTIQNGFNRGNTAIEDGWGGAFDFDTGTSGANTLTITNVTLKNNTLTDGEGGGFAIFNTNGGSGTATFSNCMVENNIIAPTSTNGTANGGGGFVAIPANMTMTNCTVSGNQANTANGVSPVGGGLELLGQLGQAVTSIHASTISGNSAGGNGGGIFGTTTLQIDQSSIISNNSGGTSGAANNDEGGGLWFNGNNSTVTETTITGNSAGNSTVGSGGGIFVNGSSGGALTVSFSRLTNNTAETGSNLGNESGTVTATDDWWGTNSPAGTISGTVTFDPFIVLSNTASPNLLKVGQTSTVTASFLQDDKGNAISASNLDVLIGLPTSGSIFSDTVSDGTLSNVQTTIQSNGEATETYTATSGGIDTVDATIDAATVPATITVLFPPSIAKAFSATHIPVFTFSPITATLTFTITNPNTANALHGLAFTDSLPSGLAVANAPNVTNTCGGILSGATAGSTSVSLSGGTITFNAGGTATCTVSVAIKGVSDGLQNNISGDVSATDVGGLTGNSASASITVINPPSITKSFAPTSIVFGATSTLTLTLNNSNANSSLSGVAFTDTFPSGLVAATPSNLNSTCSGTASGSGGPTSVSLSGAMLSPGASCTVSASVQGSVGTFNNSVIATSTDVGGLTGPTSNASLTVTKANTNTTATSSVNPSVFGQSLTFTATVSAVAPGAGTPTGVVQFLDGGSPIGSGTLSGGVATFATSALAVGSHTITTSYGGDTDFNGSTGSLTGNPQIVNKANTATAVTSSVNPSVFGQSVTFTASVLAAAPGAGTPTGTVMFLDGGSPIGSGTIIGGVATFATSALAVGSHTITTSYVGDGNFNGSAGALTGNPQVVNKGNTTTTVTSSANPQTAGQPVTFTATVSAVAPGAGTPTGDLEFLDNGSPINECGGATGEPLSGGIATCTTSTLSPGNHTITTSYGGDGNFNDSTGSLTGNPEVITQASTTTAVTSSAGTITLGDTVTFTATVTAASGTATGLVTFFDGKTPLGSGTLQLVAGKTQAAVSTSLLSAAGSPHSITATYQGATAFAVSTSSSTSETVNERTSSTGVVLNPTSVDVGQSSMATVTLTDSGSVPPGTADTFSPTGAPATGRTGFTSTLFADGLVLVAGGTDASNNVLKSTEIYSVSGAAFTATGNLNTARSGAVAVLLPTGKVLIAGGSSDGTANGALNTAELFDPSAGTFSVAGSGSSNTMTAARFGFTATLLNSGKVLIAGGANSGGVLNSAELYNPATDAFTEIGNLTSARTGASATLLGTGKVLVAGGSSDGTANGALNSAELFDPAGNSGAGTFTAVAGSNPTLAAGRWQPEAALLLSGKILVAGGQDAGGALTSADLYDPVADSFTPSNQSMSQARANGSAVALPNGTVLLAGGTTSQAVDLYDADSDRFDTTGSLAQSDNGLVSTLLNNGDVLVAGLTTAPASDAELYAPSFNPLGTVGVTSSEVTDSITGACTLIPSTSTVSTCSSTVTPVNVATSPHTITGTYPADAVHSGSNSTASLTVTQDNTTTTITANTPNPSAINQAVSVSVSVTANSPGTGRPTGTVTVSDGVGQTCVITLSSGAGSCSLTPVAAAVDTLTGTYSGDANFNGSTSNGVSQTVAAPPSMSKVFSPTSIPLKGTSTLTFTITNPAANTSAETGVAFSDTLPTGLKVATPNGLTSSCGGTSSATAGGTSISLTGGTIAVSGSCTVVVNISGTVAGSFTNTSGAVSSTNGGTGNTATATLTVVAPPSITKVFNPASIPLNGTSTLTFTLTNPAANPAAEAGVAFSDTLPAGLKVATPNGSTNSCGGTSSATAGGTSISLTGGTIALNSSCTVVVNVTGTTAGSFTNISGTVSSSNGGSGNTATAQLTVVGPPSIAKAFGSSAVAVNGTTSLTLTITNPNPTVALSGVAVTDNFPSGLEVAATPSASDGCGGTLAAVAGSTKVILTGGTVAAGGSCAISLNVTVTSSGAIVNTTGPVSSTNGGAGNAGSASLQAGDFTISATPTSESIGAGQEASITLTLSSINGFQGVISLNCLGGPPDSTCKLNPSSIDLTSASKTAKVTVQINAPPATSKGTFTLTFTGVSGALTHSTTVKLTVK